MQQAISQNSGLLAASDMAGDKLVKSNVSAAKIARHVTGCLNAFAFIKPLDGRYGRRISVAFDKLIA